MENVQRAIKGFVVMSEELENVFISLVNNQVLISLIFYSNDVPKITIHPIQNFISKVPQMWHRTNVYPSLKSLGSWVRDLELRIDFIKVIIFIDFV